MTRDHEPGIGELIEQLQRVQHLARASGRNNTLLDEVNRLAELLEKRMAQLISEPQRGEEVLEARMPPNLDLFSDAPEPFDQRMMVDRATVMEELAFWRALLEELSALLALDGKTVCPPNEIMQGWLNRLQHWLDQWG